MVYDPGPLALLRSEHWHTADCQVCAKRHLPGKHNQKDHGHGHHAMSPEEFDSAVANAAEGHAALAATDYRPSDAEVGRGLDDYAGGSYERVNDGLRASHGDPDGIEGGHYQETAQRLDRGFAESKPLDADIVVHRGVRNPAVTFGGHDPAPGLEWVDHGYGSTTSHFSSGMREQFMGDEGIQMRILVPKGTRAISSGRHLYTDSEPEILLSRGLTYRVVRDTSSGGRRSIDVQVVS
jgi:hypothetical protein